MTKNNLKVVKSDSKKTKKLKKNKSLEEAEVKSIVPLVKVLSRLGQQEALDVEAISTGSLSLI